MRGRLSASARLLIAVSALAALVLASTAAQASAPKFSLSIVGAYGGEPSIISDSNGVLYDTTPSSLSVNGSDVIPIYRSTSRGKSWTRIQEADTSSGDDCLGMDQANDLYWCNLQIFTFPTGVAPLQAADGRS